VIVWQIDFLLDNLRLARFKWRSSLMAQGKSMYWASLFQHVRSSCGEGMIERSFHVSETEQADGEETTPSAKVQGSSVQTRVRFHFDGFLPSQWGGDRRNHH
jgi:hypothetical protein